MIGVRPVPKLFKAAVCSAALTLSFGSVAPSMAFAQTTAPAPSSQAAPQRPQLDANGRPIATEGEGRFRSRGGARNRTPRVPSPAELREGAQTQATAAGLSCQVTDAVLLGKNGDGNSAYEAACAEGPGYILVSSTPPQATNCIELAGVMRTARELDPTAAVGIECKLPRNAAALPFIATYATAAGVPCEIDDAIAIGKAANGTLIFEVGCAGQEGYRINQAAGPWTREGCIEVLSTPGGACRFTTPAEQAATVKTWLAGSAAAACDVQQVRYMGRNANGAFYEAKCGDAGGYIARVNTEMAVQEVYPCADAARIGGGCKLTAATETTTTPAT